MKIAILDAGTLGSDIDLSPLRALGQTFEYIKTEPELVTERLLDADVAVVNKIKLGRNNLPKCKRLKLICVAATGFDNIDTEYCKENGIEGLIVIGGDGSFRGARDLSLRGIPCVGIPGTIDNDITSTDYTIGFDTAMNTVIENVDKLRDTACSHERCSVVEVMGHHCGDLAVCAAVSCGVEAVLVPEVAWNKEAVYADIKKGIDAGKRHAILVVCENQTDVHQMAKELEELTGLETRATVLGHIQRGGTPSAADRVLASRMGAYACELLKNGESGRCIGVKRGELVHYDIINCINNMKHQFMQTTYDLACNLK